MRKILVSALAALSLSVSVSVAQQQEQVPAGNQAGLDAANMDHKAAIHDSGSVGKKGAHPLFGDTHHHHKKHHHKCKQHCMKEAGAGRIHQDHVKECIKHCEAENEHPSANPQTMGAQRKNIK